MSSGFIETGNDSRFDFEIKAQDNANPKRNVFTVNCVTKSKQELSLDQENLPLGGKFVRWSVQNKSPLSDLPESLVRQATKQITEGQVYANIHKIQRYKDTTQTVGFTGFGMYAVTKAWNILNEPLVTATRSNKSLVFFVGGALSLVAGHHYFTKWNNNSRRVTGLDGLLQRYDDLISKEDFLQLSGDVTHLNNMLVARNISINSTIHQLDRSCIIVGSSLAYDTLTSLPEILRVRISYKSFIPFP